MRFRSVLPLLALFIGTATVACLRLAVSSDALASQLHSRLFREATERGSVSGKLSAIGDASFSVDAKEEPRRGHSLVPDRQHDHSQGKT